MTEREREALLASAEQRIAEWIAVSSKHARRKGYEPAVDVEYLRAVLAELSRLRERLAAAEKATAEAEATLAECRGVVLAAVKWYEADDVEPQRLASQALVAAVDALSPEARKAVEGE
jgi:hypothetical protein